MRELRPYERFFGEFIDRKKVVGLPLVEVGATVDAAFSRVDVLRRVIRAVPVCSYSLCVRACGC